MTWGIFKSIAKIGKKIGKTAARIGKKIIHEVPKVIKFIRTTAAPVIKDVAHVVGGVSQSLAIPAGLIAGPEATAILEGVSVGAKATEGVAQAIEKPKPKGAKSHYQPPNPFKRKEQVPQSMVVRPPPEPQPFTRPNPLMRGQQVGGIRSL
jgi:hypothetical protein